MAAHMITGCCFVLQVLIVFVGLCCADVHDFTRKITSIDFNPGCNISACKDASADGGFVNLVHIEAQGPKDSLHYIASSVDAPVVIVAKTAESGAKLQVDWNKLLNSSDVADSIKLDKPVLYSSAMIFRRLIEFNDTQDKADMTQSTDNVTLVHPMADFQWENAALFSNNSAHLAVFNASWSLNNETFQAQNGSFNIKLKTYGENVRPSQLPRLEATANMSQIEVELDNITSKWIGSRFALEIVFLTSDKEDPTKLEMSNSIDDEHTPGVFEIVNWAKNQTDDKSYTGFMQWKPVCYLSKTRGRSTGTRVRNYDLLNVSSDAMRDLIPKNSIAVAFFGSQLETMVMNATNVSFGLSEDKFYVGNNYTVWTTSFGVGTAPVDGLSLLVIIIILVGLGLPFILMVVGGIYLTVRRRSMQSDYQPIQ